ncbi:hypothetical protein GQX74_014641 [Glossina fuscipes]|nr:hypothetical protein GQX74_014641 [Glossina fuscipes]
MAPLLSSQITFYDSPIEYTETFKEITEFTDLGSEIGDILLLLVEDITKSFDKDNFEHNGFHLIGAKIAKTYFNAVEVFGKVDVEKAELGDHSVAKVYSVDNAATAAFDLAQRHNKLKLHGKLLERYQNAKSSDYLALAQYFESEMYTLLLVKYYYFLAREFTKPLRFLLKASAFNNEESQALSTAIDCVAMSNNENLAESLLGKVDGSPSDPLYLFGLYMARRHIRMRQKRL